LFQNEKNGKKLKLSYSLATILLLLLLLLSLLKLIQAFQERIPGKREVEGRERF